MKLTGGCFCKSLEYEAVVEPGRIGVCHCRDCQIFSGSAFRTVGVVLPADFKFTQGTPTCFDKTGDSGSIRRMAFCGVCGTHICALPGEESSAPFISLRVSTANQFDQLVPVMEAYCVSKVPWLSPITGAQQFDRLPPG